MRSRRRRRAVSSSCSNGRPASPLFPVEEKPFPASDVPGERAWPTQPIPSLPPPLVPQTTHRGGSLRADAGASRRVQGRTRDAAQRRALHAAQLKRGSHRCTRSPAAARTGRAPTWDPERQLLVVPVQNLAHVIRLDRVAPHEAGDVKPLHGFSFGALWWLLTGRGTGERFRLNPTTGRTVFAIDDIPCNAPPWGRLVAVDLANGTHRVERVDRARARTTRSVSPATARRSSTASGLVFHGGTRVSALRVHDADTGATHHDLRAAGRPPRGPDHVQAAPRRQAVRRRRARAVTSASARSSAAT